MKCSDHPIIQSSIYPFIHPFIQSQISTKRRSNADFGQTGNSIIIWRVRKVIHSTDFAGLK